jgi:hypothetical protein
MPGVARRAPIWAERKVFHWVRQHHLDNPKAEQNVQKRRIVEGFAKWRHKQSPY